MEMMVGDFVVHDTDTGYTFLNNGGPSTDNDSVVIIIHFTL